MGLSVRTSNSPATSAGTPLVVSSRSLACSATALASASSRVSSLMDTPSAMARRASASMKLDRRVITRSATWCLRASSPRVSPSSTVLVAPPVDTLASFNAMRSRKPSSAGPSFRYSSSLPAFTL
ncbi:hypothetical protein Y695_04768 [Hydrogenophaga sp. T4]|nr:hypothetical protein Y695_04768 [Hydrogenophaga sp. T4]